MGCFSFLCHKSGEAVLSTSFSGSPVYLFLLKDGEVLEEMYGNYDSYGGVFTTKLDTSVKHELYKSFKWDMPWGEVCNLMFSSNQRNGICAILAKNYSGVKPTTRSADDPNQGWGEHSELLGDTSDNLYKPVEEPYHKIYPEKLFTVKKALPLSGSSGKGYKSYYSVIYKGYREIDFDLTYRKTDHVWQNSRAEVEEFVSGVIAIEKLIREKILTNNDYEEYSSRRIVRFYLKFLDSWASGLDVRSSWTEEEVAEKILTSYHTSTQEASKFNNETFTRFLNKDFEEKKEAIKAFNKYKENVALYQLSKIPLDSYYLEMYPEDNQSSNNSLKTALEATQKLLDTLNKKDEKTNDKTES